MASLYGWKIGTLPTIYLGVPLGGNPRRKAFWDLMLDKLKKRARKWNSKYTFLSVRLVLMKSTLCSILVFLMSIFKAPITIVGEVEKVLRAFLWGNGDSGRKVSWKPGTLICQSKESDGHGLGFISWKNNAMLLKWVWRYDVERDSLWRKVISVKYSLDGKRLLLHSVITHGRRWLPIMQDLSKVLQEDSVLSRGVKEGIIYGLGNGRNIIFCDDP